MALTSAQLATLKAAILADTDPEVVAAVAIRNDTEIARLYNVESATEFAWKTSVTKEEIMTETSKDSTTFPWDAMAARSASELLAWGEMFSLGSVNASIQSVRNGFGDIFSGGQSNAPAMRAHLLASAKQPVRKWSKLFATAGDGTDGTPYTVPADLDRELSYNEVSHALNS